MNTQARNYSDIATESLDVSNKNISSVLSQIKDDGPANSESKEREDSVKLNMKNKQAPAQAASDVLPEKDLYSGEPLLGPANYNTGEKEKKTLFQYIAILFFTVCVMFFMYHLDDRANKLEALLSDYEEGIQDSIESYNQESPAIIQLNEDLVSIKNELKLIDTETVSATPEIEKTDHAAIQDVIVSSLEDEIQVLKMQLDKANNDLKIQLGKNESVTVEQDGLKSEKQPETSWKVNLVALSNKTRADEIVNQLRAGGQKPFIDQVTINGQLIYRLSVGGFAEFEQAELFVIIAEEEYGMKGGWIKKVGNG